MHTRVYIYTCTCSRTYISSVTRYLVLTHYLTLDLASSLYLSAPLTSSTSFETHSYSAQNEPRRGSHSPAQRTRFLTGVRARRILSNLNNSYQGFIRQIEKTSKDKSTWPGSNLVSFWFCVFSMFDQRAK